MMISCKEVQEIISTGRELSAWEKVKYKIHLFICKNCQKIEGQYKIIQSRLKNMPEPDLTEEDQCRVDDIFNRIQKK